MKWSKDFERLRLVQSRGIPVALEGKAIFHFLSDSFLKPVRKQLYSLLNDEMSVSSAFQSDLRD